MKRILLFIMISTAGLLSCTKNEYDIYKRQLMGSWHLDSTCCGFGHSGIPTDSIVLQFETSGKYRTTTNTGLTESGLYTVTAKKIIRDQIDLL